MIRLQRSPYGISLLGAGAVHHINLGPVAPNVRIIANSCGAAVGTMVISRKRGHQQPAGRWSAFGTRVSPASEITHRWLRLRIVIGTNGLDQARCSRKITDRMLQLQPAANEKRLSQLLSAGRDLKNVLGDALSAFVSSFCKTFVVVCNPKHFLLRSFIS